MFKDPLEIYDDAVTNWAAGLSVPNKDGVLQSVPVYFAGADRPLGTDPNKYGSRMVEMERGNAIMDVVRMGQPTYNPRFHSDLPVTVLWDPENKCYVVSKAIKAYLLSYQIDLVTRLRTSGNYWLNYFIFGFNPTRVYAIDFGYPFGTRRIYADLQGIVDNSDLESNEKERWIRHTVTLEFQSFMFPSVTSFDDIPDPFGQLSKYTDIRKIFTDVIVSKSLDPNDPSNLLDKTFIDQAIETVAPLQLDHK